MSGLEAVSLSVVFGGATEEPVHALSDVSLSVARGEFVSIIGPSGCGKSTLLHCLGGLLKPSSGEVHLDGDAVRAPRPDRAAYVFQDYSLFPWMRILDNVGIGLRFAGVGREERNHRALEMLKLVGLEANARSYPSELSGGMQQRVSIARALAMEPDFLLLDEPFGALDEQTRRLLGVEMARILHEAGRTVVLVTHSLDEAIHWADRVVVMNGGPGRIVDEIPVPRPRPRPMEFMNSDEFASVHARLFENTMSRGTSPLSAED